MIEDSEGNNCLAAASQVEVKAPDLIVATLSEPPASASVGSSFSVSDTTKNNGNLPSGNSTTRYYLSLDTKKSKTDVLVASRVVPGLAPGALSTDTITATIPGSTALAQYFLIACADDLKKVTEGNASKTGEKNNCRASTGKVNVTTSVTTQYVLTPTSTDVIVGVAVRLTIQPVDGNGNPTTGSAAVTISGRNPEDTADNFNVEVDADKDGVFGDVVVDTASGPATFDIKNIVVESFRVKANDGISSGLSATIKRSLRCIARGLACPPVAPKRPLTCSMRCPQPAHGRAKGHRFQRDRLYPAGYKRYADRPGPASGHPQSAQYGKSGSQKSDRGERDPGGAVDGARHPPTPGTFRVGGR